MSNPKYGLSKSDDPVTASIESYLAEGFEWGDYPQSDEYVRAAAKRLIDGGDIEDDHVDIERFYMAKGAAVAIAWMKREGLGDLSQSQHDLIEWLVNAPQGKTAP